MTAISAAGETTAAATGHSRRDARTFWRVLLAVTAPLAGIALAVNDLLFPIRLGSSSEDLVAGFAAHDGQVAGLAWIWLFVGLTIIPGAIAVAWVCRRRYPVFTAVAGSIVILGFMSGQIYGNAPNFMVMVGLDKGVDHATLATMLSGTDKSAVLGVSLLPMLLAITVGRILLGVLLWRAAVAPRWMAAALIAAPFVEFLNFSNSNVQAAIGWALTAVGFASASVALLRMRNDEFDLPALQQA